MADGTSTKQAGERVEELLARLQGDRKAAAVAEDLVRCLVDLYGAGLRRITELVGPAHTATLAGDPLVESLLLIHDLHPLSPDTRIRRALDGIRGVEYLGIDEAGVARVRLDGGGHGCQSSVAAVRQTVESAVVDVAPEVAGVFVEQAAPRPALLQIGRRPGLPEPVAAREAR